MTLTEQILDQPALVLVLGIVIELLLQYVRGIGYRRAYAYGQLRRVVWPLAHPLLRRLGRPALRDKTDADAEYICSVDVAIFTLLRALWKSGFRWNPISTLKYRAVDGRRQYAFSVAWLASTDAAYQQDVHIFRRPGGGWDLLGHWEPSPSDPDAHVGGDDQEPGDPERAVRDALVAAGIEFSRQTE